jgi:hypothetical protein
MILQWNNISSGGTCKFNPSTKFLYRQQGLTLESIEAQSWMTLIQKNSFWPCCETFDGIPMLLRKAVMCYYSESLDTFMRSIYPLEG